MSESVVSELARTGVWCRYCGGFASGEMVCSKKECLSADVDAFLSINTFNFDDMMEGLMNLSQTTIKNMTTLLDSGT